ncbi:MAG TPA: hypothetical protein VIK13_18130, partial [Candidatus Limnocylindrales bacterium]
MTETNEIEFLEPVKSPGGTPPKNGRPGSQSLAVRIGIVAGSALLVVVGVAAVMGASPAPTTPAANPGGHAFGMRGGDFGGVGFNDIKITSISGSNLS